MTAPTAEMDRQMDRLGHDLLLLLDRKKEYPHATSRGSEKWS